MEIKNQLNELTEAELSLLIYKVCTRLNIGYYTYLIDWLNHIKLLNIDTTFYNVVVRDYGHSTAMQSFTFIRFCKSSGTWKDLIHLKTQE